MDILDLKKRLSKNPKEIVLILEFYEYRKIKVNHKEIRFARNDEGSGNSIKVSLSESLYTTDFVTGDKGDLFSLIMAQKNKTFVGVLSDIKGILSIDSIKKKETVSVFGNIFNKVNKANISKEEIKVYSLSELIPYGCYWNERFLRDGISVRIQKEFRLGFDDESQRITVPWFTPNGELCGIMGRLNYDHESYPKWFPIIAFTKSNMLYGYSENYKFLLEEECIFIGESEKFVLQLASMGFRNAVALGGSNLSETQIEYIMHTRPKKIYLCYDEGLSLEVIKNNLVKFKPYFKIRNFDLFLVYDRNNKYMPVGSKVSPTDLGKETFKKIIGECSKKINRK